MAIFSEMTVSVSKGKPSESSDEHNDRKSNLEKASEKKKDAFYTKTGHKHIHREYTYLNDDLLIRKPSEAYDDIFEESIKEYNDSKTRNDRKIGKGKALTRAEKTAQLQAWTMVHDMRKLSKKNQKLALAKFAKSYPMASKVLQDLVERTDDMTLKDIRKQVTRAKHAKTLGQAYYEKQKHSKQQRTAVEFVIQVGNAEDFNEIDENGRIIKSYDRTDPTGIWQRSKKVLKDYYKEFKKNNPNLVPINASIHMDESTPHLHLKVIPVADRDQMQMRGHGTIDKKTGKVAKKARHTGLSKKVSFNGALECEGFKRDSSDNRSQFKNWQHREAETLAKIMQNELGVERKKGLTNKLKNVHEYKKVKEEIAEQREKAQKTLSNVQKERRDQLYALSQEIAQKRSEKLRELSRELEEKRQKEENKLKARETALTNRENAVNKRETRLRNWATDLNAKENGGLDSKGIKHKSIEERIRDGIRAGMQKVLHPLKAFRHGYLNSLIRQQLAGVDERQIKEIVKQQEASYGKEAMVAALSGASGKAVQHQAVKAVGAGALAMAKDLPKYKDISDTVAYTAQVQALEKEDERRKAIENSKDTKEMDDF